MVQDYLGKPWEKLARGPNAFDCWGLVRQYYLDEYSLELPLHVIDPDNLLKVSKAIRNALSSEWIELEEPEKDCLIVMSSKSQPHHVGICVSIHPVYMLHSAQGQGTCCQSISVVTDTMAIKKMQFYRHGKLSNHKRSI